MGETYARRLRIISPEELQVELKEPVDATALVQARTIVEDVKKNGLSALRTHAQRLGDIPTIDSKILYSYEELKPYYDSLPEEQKNVLTRTKDRIEKFALAQRASISDLHTNITGGGNAGHTIAPMNVAGCYAPGGRYPLPSSVLMTAVTARAAGVPTVFVASPRPSPVTLAAAYVAKADYLLALGGAQAIAALAYGTLTEEVQNLVAPKQDNDSNIENSMNSNSNKSPSNLNCICDIIVGPGNKWVTAAKSLVQGICAIDMLAGPSEVLVIADKEGGTGHEAVIASDLLAQAEHDTEARPILVCTDDTLINTINDQVYEQLCSLPTASTAFEACAKGFIVKVNSIEEAINISDQIAPEHLEIQVGPDLESSRKAAFQCQNYGAVFIGHNAAEVLGDYGAGPNHVLPTGGTAKYTGGLSVFTFLKIRTYLMIENLMESQEVVEDSVCLARLEGLEGHARAAEKRIINPHKKQKI